MNNEFKKIRSGRVSLSILDSVKVNAYGEFMNLNQLANLQIVDARQILVKPYDRSQIHEIAKAIAAINLGVNPQVNPDNIRLIFPAQTEENRIQNVKKAKAVLEQTKEKIREIRKDIQATYKKLTGISEDVIHYFEEELNKLTKKYNNDIEAIFANKEKELMTI
ncbi:MAG: ribosome recycling factor [Mycoplasmoidaceae bacterium]|nr:ribosome recycling factor [Mycoplasmoidaceae bacterium]